MRTQAIIPFAPIRSPCAHNCGREHFATGLTLSEYTVLMHLSEADGGELRVTDLASATALSLSRISRVVNSLQARGWVGRRRHVQDARGWVTSLTDEGLRRLESVSGAAAECAPSCRRVVGHVDCDTAVMTAHQVRRIAFPPA
ncbi:MarR family winged helix-turn-helix transcriptional regulator [Actinacidiphila glaucinigra]|uniref:MarR family winged helix-turn-helix transcriptional regulator n=1 Tax=Actinacidiphila glaucinigra TaxID=235986 RepID=UPI0033B5DD2F